MAKKKTHSSEPKPKPFRSDPFSALKGVAVVVPEQKPAAAKAAAAPPPPVADDSDLFFEAMEGVKRVGEQPAPVKAAAKAKQSAVPVSPVAVRRAELERAEREAFAQAIGQLKLDVTFSDQIPEDEELKPLGANRLRQLKRGVISVDRQLDLHGLIREEALEALPRFLKSAIAHGEKAVLVITGKGNNSPAEPVLQQAVAGWLRDAGKSMVVEYAPAPREMGGSGAFVVFLRG